MNNLSKVGVAALCMLSLGSCKEAQLGGPVTNADILIDLLNQPGASFQFLTTSSSTETIDAVGIGKWTTMSDAEKFLRVGNFEVDDALVDQDALFLVAARFGKDVDSDRNGKYDVSPTDVGGEWRAIMPGSELMANGTLVSALTEAAYQYVFDDIGLVSDQDLLDKLDEFAQLVISDVDKDGDVDYADVLRWTRLYSQGQYLGDIAFIDDLIAAITDDEPDNIRYAAAASVWSNQAVAPVFPGPEDGTIIGGATLDEDVFWTREGSPYIIGSNFNLYGDLHIEGGVEVRGNGHRILLFGDLMIEGLPRNPARIFELDIVASNFSFNSDSIVKFAHIEEGKITTKVRKFVMEDSYAREWELEIRGITNDAGHFADIKRNIFEKTEITFKNRSPDYNNFTVDFVNNLITPPNSIQSEIITEWEGPEGNLTVENNTFHQNMRILRGNGDPVLNVQRNYWGTHEESEIDFGTIIPDNAPDGDYAVIRWSPILDEPHPDTPLAP